MSGVHKVQDNPVINICGKSILDYVAESLAKFNRGANRITLRTVSGSESMGVEIAHILNKFFDVRLCPIELKRLEIGNVPASSLEIPLEYETVVKSGNVQRYPSRGGFVEFIIYNLLLDWLLAQKGCLNISYKTTTLISVHKSDFDWICETKAQDNATLDDLASVYYRCGLLISDVWRDIATKLSRHDDAILGLDTNMLYVAAVTEQLLPSLTIIDPREYVHTPNWLFLIIPSSVMHEIEQAANYRDGRGHLQFPGRIGFRALQEILELDNNADLSGISISIVGETDPTLDTRIELQGLRQDLVGRKRKEAEDNLLALLPLELTRTRKMSTGDTIIRDQFRAFLRQISFHKAAYFLTADKSHAALAKAEGLQAVYYKTPSWKRAEGVIKPPEIHAIPQDIKLSVPLGKLMYELAVQFGSIKVRWDKEEIEIACDTRAETLDHWIHKELAFKDEHIRKLLEIYRSGGRFALNDVAKAYDKFNKLIEEPEF